MDRMSSIYLEYIADEASIFYFISAICLIVGVMGGIINNQLLCLIPIGLVIGAIGLIYMASEQGWVDWVNEQI